MTCSPCAQAETAVVELEARCAALEADLSTCRAEAAETISTLRAAAQSEAAAAGEIAQQR